MHMQSPSEKQQQELFTKDSNNDGIPDVIEDPDKVLDQVTLPDGRPLPPLQRKIMKKMFGLAGSNMGRKIIKNAAQQTVEGTVKAASHASSHQTGGVSKKGDWIRIFLIVDAIIIIGILYFVFGR